MCSAADDLPETYPAARAEIQDTPETHRNFATNSDPTLARSPLKVIIDLNPQMRRFYG